MNNLNQDKKKLIGQKDKSSFTDKCAGLYSPYLKVNTFFTVYFMVIMLCVYLTMKKSEVHMVDATIVRAVRPMDLNTLPPGGLPRSSNSMSYDIAFEYNGKPYNYMNLPSPIVFAEKQVVSVYFIDNLKDISIGVRPDVEKQNAFVVKLREQLRIFMILSAVQLAVSWFLYIKFKGFVCFVIILVLIIMALPFYFIFKNAS